MKILAFTDNHGSPDDLRQIEKKAKQVDIIVCGGDFTIFEHQIEYHLEKLNNLPRKVLLIHGNHEDEEILRIYTKHYKNIEFIHAGYHDTGTHVFIGYGGGGFTTTDKKFEEISKKFPRIMEGKKSIIVFHGPPHGTRLDLMAEGYVGNKSFTRFIVDNQPALVICGHLHEHFNKKDKIGKTIVINPGPTGEIIEI
ncbi:MAG: metallophosphoesterase family protein [Nanoarchaeota archaeon]|nr:metallophosphoesterase family protein [Nanoarchaeota archaeon]MBU1269506.1 metallophosphoesterase family protein [Nanoarchaeota archaeon]MBU1603897.1 metallophosphoesterase family protein [Nanoarchaeota archaeon]MBU2442901.1 metallophosphoesterase family protein [Nanoarchaeota archaeon]